MSLEEARELAYELMSDFGLYYWKFKFDYAKTRFGCCDERRKEISLSKHLVLINDEDVVKNVILHEIAHALVGCKHKHNYIFQQKTRDIGCEYASRYCFENVNRVPKNIVANCPKCGNEVRKYRKPSRKKSCGKCSDKFDNERLLIFQREDTTSKTLLKNQI
jgi:predicted SprT family Zn-dependent metalloprotease